MQLRLQQTVEGLSVAAISYYTIALLKILFDALESTGVPIRSDIAVGSRRADRDPRGVDAGAPDPAASGS